MRMFRCNRDASPVPEHQGQARYDPSYHAMALSRQGQRSDNRSIGTLRLSATKFGSARRALAVTISRLILGRR
jgi:hypothetical protein